MKQKNSNFRKWISSSATLCAAAFAISVPMSAAQTPKTSGADAANASGASAAAADNSKAAILEELEQMRARIQQLEAQLRTRSEESAAPEKNSDRSRQQL